MSKLGKAAEKPGTCWSSHDISLHFTCHSTRSTCLCVIMTTVLSPGWMERGHRCIAHMLLQESRSRIPTHITSHYVTLPLRRHHYYRTSVYCLLASQSQLNSSYQDADLKIYSIHHIEDLLPSITHFRSLLYSSSQHTHCYTRITSLRIFRRLEK